jgi:threonine dehydrogenase-like Zn-dependent dehydrogenase
LHGPHDARFEDRPEPSIFEPTDAIINLPVTCICGSDLWPYRGIQAVPAPVPMGHEYCGIVEEVGRRGVTSLKPGQFVIGSGKVFDLVLPLNQVADGYRAMDERRAIKTLLRP